MFGSARLVWPSGLSPRIQAWTQDRSVEHLEGERLLDEGEYREAELHLVKAMIDGERRRLSPQKRVDIRLRLAEAQRKQFDVDGVRNPALLSAAGETLQSALTLARGSGDRPSIIQCLDALADVAAASGKFAEVEDLTTEATQIESAMLHANPLWAAQRSQRFAAVCRKTGRTNDAALHLAKAVAIFERSFGADHLVTANHLTELGETYCQQGDYNAAQGCLRRALRVHEKEHGMESPQALRDIGLLTSALEGLGDIDGAAQLHERVLMLKLREVGGDLDEIAKMQAKLAAFYMKWQKYSRARELLLEVIGTFKRTRGVSLAEAYESLALLEETCGHYHDALRELGSAGKVWETIQNEHTPELVRNMQRRAELYEQLRQHKEAAYYRDRAAALVQAQRWVTAS